MVTLDFASDPAAFEDECRSLPADRKGQFVFVDEAQSAPSIFDSVQHLYDGNKTRWRFVLHFYRCVSRANSLIFRADRHVQIVSLRPSLLNCIVGLVARDVTGG
jgi:hypothetical protein